MGLCLFHRFRRYLNLFFRSGDLRLCNFCISSPDKPSRPCWEVGRQGEPPPGADRWSYVGCKCAPPEEVFSSTSRRVFKRIWFSSWWIFKANFWEGTNLGTWFSTRWKTTERKEVRTIGPEKDRRSSLKSPDDAGHDDLMRLCSQKCKIFGNWF